MLLTERTYIKGALFELDESQTSLCKLNEGKKWNLLGLGIRQLLFLIQCKFFARWNQVILEYICWQCQNLWGESRETGSVTYSKDTETEYSSGKTKWPMDFNCSKCKETKILKGVNKSDCDCLTWDNKMKHSSFGRTLELTSWGKLSDMDCEREASFGYCQNYLQWDVKKDIYINNLYTIHAGICFNICIHYLIKHWNVWEVLKEWN